MTLKDLKQRAEKAGFKYAYGTFKNSVNPPHLVALCKGSTNYFADNKVYYKKIPVQLDYTYLDKNEIEQLRIEEEVLKDIAWNKSDETYLPDEKIWQVSYFFELEGGI